MTWGKVSDRLHAHSKARRAREAMALWVLAMSWSCDELTDGAVPADMPELLIPGGGDAMAEKLVSVGLWERTESGFRFHDWLEFQPPADDERDRRGAISKARSEAGKRGNAKRWGDRSQTDRKVIANGSQTDRKTIATPSQNDRPVPVPVPEADSLRSSAAFATPKPSPLPTGAAFDVLAEITAGASQGHRPGAWDYRGDARTVAAFVRALAGLQRSPKEMRLLGRYLASQEATEQLKSRQFAPRTFVIYGQDGAVDTSKAERACLLAAEWASRSSGKGAAVAAHRPAVIATPKGRLVTPEEIRARRLEAEQAARAAREDNGNDDDV